MKLVALEISIFARNYWNDYRENREWRHFAHNCNLNTVWFNTYEVAVVCNIQLQIV